MEQTDIEKLIGELETAVDRLRSLYEQYFMGIEKIEPMVPRKDVERRVYVLRKEQIRNTALRFRFHMLLQRYNTYQTHWQRVCRDIENGTYKRHVVRAQRRFGTKRSSLPPPGDRAPERTFADELAELDRDFAPAEMVADGDVELDDVPPSTRRSQSVRRSDTPARITGPAPRTPPPPRSFPPKPPPRSSPPKTPPPHRSSPPKTPPPHRSFPPKTPPPHRTSPPKTPPPPSAPTPPPPRTHATGRPLPRTHGAEPGGRPVQTPPPRAFSPPARLAPPPAPISRAAITPGREEGASATLAKRGPQPVDLSEERVRQLYSQYVETRRRQNESTASITYDAVARSLRQSSAKLRQKLGRSVDFEVIVKDGRAILRPVVK